MNKTLDQLKKDLDFAIELQKYYLQKSGKYSSLATLNQRGAEIAKDAYLTTQREETTADQNYIIIILGAIDAFEKDAQENLRLAASYSKEAYGKSSDKVRAARLSIELHIDSRDHDTDSIESPVNTNPTEVTIQEHRDTFGY